MNGYPRSEETQAPDHGLTHRQPNIRRQRQRGAALVLALALLGVFVLLGMAYWKFSTLQIEEANLNVRNARAQMLAKAGVNAGIASIERALREGEQTPGAASFSFPAYAGVDRADGTSLVELDRTATADIVIRDEGGKVNLNHAPASVLQAILGVDGATARNITGSLPRGDGSSADASKRWLLHVDDLLTRGLLSPEQFAQVNPDWVTTHSVPDHSRPLEYLSINAAPAEVVAAVLDLPLSEAQQVVEKGPFSSIEALAQAAGKGPEMFNLKPGFDGSHAFTFASHCFRIESRGQYSGSAEAYRASAGVEAIVHFTAPGAYEIVRWYAGRGAGIIEAAVARDAGEATDDEAAEPAA